MDQDVQTSDAVTFGSLATTGNIAVAADARIGVGTSSPAASMDIESATRHYLDQSQENFSFNLITNSAWQSFTAGVTGQLSQVCISLAPDDTTSNATLRIYSGEGTGGTLELTQSVADGLGDMYVTVELDTPVSISAGSKYTIHLTNGGGNVGFAVTNYSSYAGGEAAFGSGYDLRFKTYVADIVDGIRVAGPVLLEDFADPPLTKTDRLYNNGGDLHWNGTQTFKMNLDVKNSAAETNETNNSQSVAFLVELGARAWKVLSQEASHQAKRVTVEMVLKPARNISGHHGVLIFEINRKGAEAAGCACPCSARRSAESSPESRA